MITIRHHIIGAVCLMAGMTACTDLEEKVYDRIDASVYYQNEASVKGAVAAIYSQTASTLAGENFFHLSEYPADQITWRVWNGGQCGWDEAMKTVLSWHNWTSESTIINNAWKGAWTAVGLANLLLNDLEGLDAASLGISQERLQQYVAEVRTLRAWNYYCIFELWGGALPLNTSASSDVPGTADADWNTSCKMIYDFIANELDETYSALAREDGSSHTTVNRANQGMNRMLKARLLLNAEVFIGEKHYDECETLSKEIINGVYGAYGLDTNYRSLYSIDNVKSPEVVFALAAEDGQGAANAISNVRTMVGMWYGYADYFGQSYDGIGAWNCVCLVPSFDNSGNVLPSGGTDNPVCFLDAPYNDKLGAPYERFDNRDIRKQNYVYNAATKTHGPGMFLKGEIRANFGTGDALLADADRDGQALVYVDQLGTFLNQGRNLETVMNPRWGETNSGVRLVKYPLYPNDDQGGFKSIDDVQFRLAEAYYNVAECEMRKGNSSEAKSYVDQVRQRYFTNSDRTSALSVPGPGFSDFDLDWMLSEWGKEYLGEGNRRRTDLRRFDKFTQGTWWFWGRATEDGVSLPPTRDRKYEWYPLPQSALSVNPGLVQNPNYEK